MTSKSKIMIVMLSLAVAAVAGFTLSMPQAKHLLSAAASAVWGS